jgi:anti-sigma factor RsiW
MNDHFRTITSVCGDADALITYLYGESTEEERERIEAHLVQCATCAEEVATLGATREQLAAWTPPDRALGFQLTQTAVDRSAGRTVLPFDAAQTSSTAPAPPKPSRWWHEPLPAWAQLAAAVAIFASGLAMGAARHPAAALPSAVTVSAPAATPTRTAATSATVSRQDLAQVEARLRSEMAQLQTESRATGAGVTLQGVKGLIADSEARQRKELDYRTSLIVSDFKNARDYDNSMISRQLQQTNGVTFANTQNINSLARQVGWSPAASPYVP